MNILYNHRTRCTGADGTHIKGVAAGFIKLGNSVDIVSPKICQVQGGRQQPSYVNKKTRRSSFIIKLPRVLFEFLELLYNIPSFFRLFSVCKGKKYDAVYERYAFLNLGGYWMSRILGIPLFLEVNFTTQTTVYPKRTGFFSFPERWVERKVFARAAIIIVISDKLKKDISSKGIDADKILVVPNAVDVDDFKPTRDADAVRRQYDIDENSKIIGFVGSFYPWHGLDFLLDSVMPFLKERDDITLMLIGSGQMHEPLLARVRDERLEKHVVFTGPVPHDELPDYVNVFTVGVMPDSNNYGSPMKIFEYMALEKPVVAVRLPPIEAVITDGREGLLFTQKNCTELREALIRLLDNEELRAAMGKNGKSKVLREHTWDKNVSKIISLYNQITERR